MLWYDNSPRSLLEKVQEAAEYYAQKYGRVANICFVDPEQLNGADPAVDGIQIEPNPMILRNHFWIWVKDPN